MQKRGIYQLTSSYIC